MSSHSMTTRSSTSLTLARLLEELRFLNVSLLLRFFRLMASLRKNLFFMDEILRCPLNGLELFCLSFTGSLLSSFSHGCGRCFFLLFFIQQDLPTAYITQICFCCIRQETSVLSPLCICGREKKASPWCKDASAVNFFFFFVIHTVFWRTQSPRLWPLKHSFQKFLWMLS